MEHTRFVGLDIHKERISIAVAERGRSSSTHWHRPSLRCSGAVVDSDQARRSGEDELS